jgi:two-component system sensor histidine kinase DesK
MASGAKAKTTDFGEEIENLKAPNSFTFLPWLLMGAGSFSNVIQGRAPLPWLGGLGLLAFNSLYIGIVSLTFQRRPTNERVRDYMLLALGVVTYALAIGYAGSWLLFFPLLSLACGIGLRVQRRHFGLILLAVSVSAAVITGFRSENPWDAVSIGYGTLLSGLVTSTILALFGAIAQLRDTRQQLARHAVAEERLRFSRDLHDLLGHTLSVVVVKSEAARRLAPRDLDAALVQVADIEAVGRQALTEIREAVTGYREGSLATEVDRARSALSAAGIDSVVRQSGQPLPPQTEALLGWVVREAATNAIRHSHASSCTIALTGSDGLVRLEITDDGHGIRPAPAGTTGTGLKGLAERLAAAGGSLDSGPAKHGGFRVTAELPVGEEAA